MKKNLILVLLFCITIIISAQTAIWQSAFNVDIIGTAYVIDAVSDEMGNSYYTGFFYNTITLGEISLTSYGGSDIFVAKTNNSNEWQWAVNAGSNRGSSNIDGELWESARKIKIDNSGNIVVVGSYAGAASFGSIQQTYRGGLCDVFVAKLNPSGEWLWVASGDSSYHDRGVYIDTDNDNNIFISGTIYANATFGSISVTRDSFDDGFVAKLDSNGNWLWVRKPISVSSAHDGPGVIKVDSEGNLISTFGDQFGNYTFGSIVLSAIGTDDNVIAKIDTDGNWLWANRYMNGTTNGVEFIDLTCNSDNDIYVAGLLKGTVSIGSTQLLSSGDEDILLIKFDSNGNFLWGNSYGGVGPDRGKDITIDSANNPCISGYFSNSLSFDAIQLNSSGDQDLFVLQVIPSGEVLSALSAGGTSEESSINLQVKDDASLTVWGTYLDSANFGSTELSGSTSINNTFISTVTLVEPVEPTIVEQFDPIQLPQNSSITLDLTTYFAEIYSDLAYTVVGDYVLILDINTNNLLSLQSTTDWYGTEYITIRATNQWGLYIEQVLRVSVFQTLAESESFNNLGQMPENWTVSHYGSTDYPWSSELILGDDYLLKTQVNTGKTANERLFSPIYNFSNYQNISVSIATDFLPYENAQASFAYTLNNITYTVIETFTEASNGVKTYLLPNLTGKSNVKFRWIYGNSTVNTGQDNYLTIDDFNISGDFYDSDNPEIVNGLTLISQTSNSATLVWQESSEPFFERYELFISQDAQVDMDDQVWSVEEDSTLFYRYTTETTIENLNDGDYWISIRVIDQANNLSDMSQASFVHIDSSSPLITNPTPSAQPNPILQTSRTLMIGCSISDLNSLDMNSIKYRVDYNGNGIYDESESWLPVPETATSVLLREDINISFEVNYDADGLLAFEFQASDIYGNIAYSGLNSQLGIDDDWVVKISTVPPASISTFFVQEVADSTIQLGWEAETNIGFLGYRIYYSTSSDVDTLSSIWDWNNDLTLNNSDNGLISTTIDDLTPGTRYYFMLESQNELGGSQLYPDIITAMTSSSAPPETPGNLTIEVSDGLIILDWDDVNVDIFGNNVVISYYEVYVGDHPDFECDFNSFIGTVNESYFELPDVVEYADKLFFKIRANSGMIRRINNIQKYPINLKNN